MKIEKSDYKYICIIIFLIALMFFFVLPFTYSVYNGVADTPDCLADMNSVKCYTDINLKNVCDYNCTLLDATIQKVRYQQP
jgi:hypothetical protein